MFAQNADDAKQRLQHRNMVIEQILADLPNLRLGENRAVVYAKVGNLIWDSDQKRARAFFQNAAGELMNAQMLAESNQKNTTFQNELLTGQSTRPQILNTIAPRDAELALDLLVKTRPSAIVKALSMALPKNSKISNYSNNFSYLAQNEFNMEQSFVRLAAEQSPNRAATLLKESLTKGLSNETLNLLKKLHEKDPDLAAGLGSEIVDKLIQSKFTIDSQANYQNIQIAINFLSDFIRQRNPGDNSFRFSESEMHTLADKLISYYLDHRDGQASYLNYSVIPIAEKLSPATVEQLKKISKNYPGRGEFSGYDPELQKLLSSDKTAEELLAEAKNYSAFSRRQIYQTAANKYLQQSDFSRASGILNDNFSDDALDEAMKSLKSQWASNLISQGKFSDAETMIDEGPENTRNYQYINLANAIYQKDPKENKSYAMAVLSKARSLISERPENSAEMSNLMQIISAYTNIESSEAFRLFEPIVPQINELSDASAVLAEFQGGSGARDGETLISQGNSFGFYLDYSIFGQLSQKDFDRTMSLIDAFTRRETRISLKLQAAERLVN
jgi:hypothetical protein